MRFVRFKSEGVPGLGVVKGDEIRGFLESTPDFPGQLTGVMGLGGEGFQAMAAALEAGSAYDPETIAYLPPLAQPPKIICVGLNYRDHSAESGFEQPTFPTFFARFPSSLIGHRAPMIKPSFSDSLDFECELVVVIGKRGRHIARKDAVQYICGYSAFNDGSIREYQFRSPQWMIGKNFDGTGAFGPHFVTADELPEFARGLKIETRLNGNLVQSSNTEDLVFDVPAIIEHLSEVMTLEVGDVIVTGTPAGVGFAREPKLYMQAGDICEVAIEGVGVLTNPIVEQAAA